MTSLLYVWNVYTKIVFLFLSLIGIDDLFPYKCNSQCLHKLHNGVEQTLSATILFFDLVENELFIPMI